MTTRQWTRLTYTLHSTLRMSQERLVLSAGHQVGEYLVKVSLGVLHATRPAPHYRVIPPALS